MLIGAQLQSITRSGEIDQQIEFRSGIISFEEGVQSRTQGSTNACGPRSQTNSLSGSPN